MIKDNNSLFYASCIRLIYDFIVADGYISQREMELVKKYEKKYDLLNSDYIRLSKTLSFSAALNIISNSPEKKRNNLLNVLEEISGTCRSTTDDSTNDIIPVPVKCSPREARLLLAVRRVLKNNAMTCSIEKPFKISKKEIIYLEGAKPESDKMRVDIIKNYWNYKTRLAIYGLDFSTVEQVNEKLLRGNRNFQFVDGCINGIPINNLLEYLYPLDTDPNLRESIVGKLENISTKEFTTDLLGDDTKLLNKVGPSLLLKLKDTMIEDNQKYVMDCLIIPIEADITTTIDNLIIDFVIISNGPFSDFTLNRGDFNIKGWEKTYLDYVMTKNRDKLIVSKLDICYQDDGNHSKKRWNIKFYGSAGNVLCTWKLAPLSLSLYLLVLYMSTKEKYVPDSKTGKEDIDAVYNECEATFIRIYRQLSSNSNEIKSSYTDMFTKFKTGDTLYNQIPEPFKIKEQKVDKRKLWRITKYDIPITISGNGIIAQSLERFCSDKQ